MINRKTMHEENQQLTDNLSILAKYYKKTGDGFRANAYNNAVESLRKFDRKITSLSQINNVKGIGKSIKEKIHEYLVSGQIAKVEQIKALTAKTSKDKVIDLFTGIWGIGPSRAELLYKKGFRTIEDLRKNQSYLTDNQKIGLKYYEDLLKKIPREKISILSLVIRYILYNTFGKDASYKMTVAGSYRRGKAESGDIDILFTSEEFELQELVDVLISNGVITDILAIKEEKFMGIAHCPAGGQYMRLDIEFLPKKYYESGLLYFTGSKEFNVEMRQLAKSQNKVLNQRGLYDENGRRLPLYTEKDIMKNLGMKYVPPNKR